jgi:hypothetical protein
MKLDWIPDLGRVVFINIMLSSAVQDGTRAGMVSTSYTAIEDSIRSRLGAVDLDELAIQVNKTDDYVEVEILNHFTPITPFVPAFSRTIRLFCAVPHA